MNDDSDYEGDYAAIASFLNPTDAHLLRGCLEASGIPAMVADSNLVQANSLLAVAVGGVRVLVPDTYIVQAQEVMRALDRGAYMLDENTDVGPAAL